MSTPILKQSVGIDVSKDSFDACFCQSEPGQTFRVVSSRKFAYSVKGFKQLHEWTQRFYQAPTELHLLMEATGIYYESLAYFLHSHHYRVTVILPNKAKSFFRTLDYKSKTDKIDAKALGQMALEKHLKEWMPPGNTMLIIKQLCRQRAELLKTLVTFKNRLHAREYSYEPQKSCISINKSAISYIQKQVNKIEALIETTIDHDQDIAQKIKQICTIPGVGTITAATVVAETNGFALFKNKAQLVSYAGLDVVHHQSGSSINAPAHISKRGNRTLRNALYWPAICAVRCNPKMTDIFNNVLQKSLIKMKAYVCIQRKLLVLIYTLYKNETSYNPDFISSKNT